MTIKKTAIKSKKDNNDCIIDIVGNKLLVLAKEPSKKLNDTLVISELNKTLKIEWHPNKNSFIKELLNDFNLLKNGTFGDSNGKSLSGWDINVKEPASGHVDLSEEWHLKDGHTAFLLAPKEVERPCFMAKHKIPAIGDGSVNYRFSGFFATHRASGRIIIEFYDKADNKLGEEIITIPLDPKYGGGQSLMSYAHIESIFTPVKETQYMRFKIELGDQEIFTEPHACLFFSELFLGFNTGVIDNNFVPYSDSIDRLTNNLLANKFSIFGIAKLPALGKESFVSIDYLNNNYDLDLKNEFSVVRCIEKINSNSKKNYYKVDGKEKRYSSYESWLKDKNLDANHFGTKVLKDLVQYFYVNSEAGDFQDVLDIISAEKVQPIKLAKTSQRTAFIYKELGKKHVVSGGLEKGLILFRTSLLFNQDAETYQLIGNIYLEKNYNKLAIKYYKKSLQLRPDLFWPAYNLINAHKKLNDYSGGIFELTNILKHQSNKTQFLDLLDELCSIFWQEQQALANLFIDNNDRKGLIELNKTSSEIIYQAYLNAAGQVENPPLGIINAKRILIIGDYHISQCIRYRINQKKEQLELLGKKVTELDWTQLDKVKHELATHDIVIFYRVPSVPQVLKAMAQTNSAGKLSIYEIDDLLFDEAYPPPLETYGGYVDIHTYQELSKGMGLFNSAARFCRIGLASTAPLTKHLEKLVFDHQCLLHRNGLDSLNQFRAIDKSHKKTIDIFYGSGTQAHNTDFIDLALPAIERILEENKKLRFIVVGYLNLPQNFILKFKDQFKQIPPTKKVQHYWLLLEKADINIAVLHDDEINNCKSELKWFEAACFAIPSIVSNTQNYQDVIRHGEDGYIASSSEEWYQALHALANNSEKRKKMGQAAMQRVKEEYSLQTLGSQLVKNLDQYLAEQTKQLAKKPNKKIALVNVFFAPQSIGGATRVVEDNFDVLIEQYKDDYELCVFTADAECRTPHQLTVYCHKGVRVYRATTLWREHMDWHPKDPEMYSVFSEFLADEQPELVHFHCVQRLTASIVEATRDLKIPYIITAHDAWWISDFQFLVNEQGKVYEHGHPDVFEPIQLPANITMDESIDRKQYLKSLLHDAKQVLTVSEAFAEIYRKNGVTNISVTKNGISSNIDWRPKETSDTSKVICGHIGGMSAHKGYDILQKAVIESQPKNLEFLIVDHSKESDYELCETWGNVPVTFVGRAKQNDIVKLYQKIDVLFAPSIWPESFGLVTREAAACRCWVVASNLGGVGEDVIKGKNGFVIEPTQEALENILNKISSNPNRFKRLASNKKIAKVEEQVKELVRFYR